MDEFYNKHYIQIDDRNRIIYGYSDAFLKEYEQPAESDICINEQGGYQFKLKFADGTLSEENPVLYDFDYMIPLYAYENGAVIARTSEEINADIAAIPIPAPTPTLDERVSEVETDVDDLNSAMNALLTGEGMI